MNATANPTETPDFSITIHRDKTVSFYSVSEKQWKRVKASYIGFDEMCDLGFENRAKIINARNRCH
jgi:hypothetical protein